MTIFRWIVGVIAALLASGALLSLLLYLTVRIDVWAARARRLRHWTWLVLLFWFNAEIWIRVGGALRDL